MLVLAQQSIFVNRAQGIDTLRTVVIAAIITIVDISKRLATVSEIDCSVRGSKTYQIIWLKKKSLKNFQVTYSIA